MNTTTHATPNRVQTARELGQAIRNRPEAERADAYRAASDKVARAILTRLENGFFVGARRAPEEFEVLLALAAILDTMNGTAE